MKIFFHVTDLENFSFLVFDPTLVDINEPYGILRLVFHDDSSLYINWNLKQCLDALSLLMDHDRIEFDILNRDYSWNDPDFDDE